MFLSGLVNPVEEITLQGTNNRRTVKRLSRSVTTDEHGQAKVSAHVFCFLFWNYLCFFFTLLIVLLSPVKGQHLKIALRKTILRFPSFFISTQQQ